MNDLLTLGTELMAWYGSLSPITKGLLIALAIAVAFHCAVWAAERMAGTRGDEYRTRDYGFDLAYWFFYRSGLNYFLIVALVYPPFDQPLPWLDLGLLAPYPIAVQALVFFVATDFYSYWSHRAFHRFKFLWAFHTMHHAPEHITYASSARFHPGEILIGYLGYYLLVRISGSNPLAWLPAMAFLEVMLQAQHTRIPWKLGPLYNVFVTPTFHRFHHSSDPAHYDRNFGGVLTIWDRLFGTALPYRDPAPQALGVPGIRHDTLLDTLVQPVRLACGLPGKPAKADEVAAPQ